MEVVADFGAHVVEDDLLEVAAEEGGAGGDHLVQYDAEREHVGGVAVGQVAQHLGTHVAGRAAPGEQHVGVVHELAQAEVHDLDLFRVLAHEHQVLGLQVPVDEPECAQTLGAL